MINCMTSLIIVSLQLLIVLLSIIIQDLMCNINMLTVLSSAFPTHRSTPSPNHGTTHLIRIYLPSSNRCEMCACITTSNEGLIKLNQTPD